MNFDRPLNVVTPSVDGDVLTALALADAWFTTGRIHQTIGRHSEDGVRRVLRRLAEQGIVETLSGGPAVLYRLNRRHLAAPAVIQLANLRWDLVHRLSDALKRWTVPPVFAALFGSAAWRGMSAGSDIDIFLVRPDAITSIDEWAESTAELQSDVSAWTGNDARVFELSEENVLQRAADEPVIGDVIDHGIPLLGDMEWLARHRHLTSHRG
jgi:hypothetical protein